MSRKQNKRRALTWLLCAAGCFVPQKPASAADIQVTNTNDSGAGSLRAALTAAAPGDRIVFANSLSGTIDLNTDLPPITGNLTFVKPDANTITIDRTGQSPLVVRSGSVDFDGLRFVGAGEDVQIQRPATLLGNQQTVFSDLNVRGTIAPGSSPAAGSIGELAVQGDVDATTATLAIDVRGNLINQHDRLNVIGNLTLTDAALSVNFIGDDFEIGDTIQVVQADTITGSLAAPSGPIDLPNNPFFAATVIENIDSIRLQINDNGRSFRQVIEGCNQLQAAAALDTLRASPTATLTQQDAIAALRNGSRQEVNRAVDQLSAVIYPSLASGQINLIQNHLHSLRDRIVMQRDALEQPNRWIPWVRGFGMSETVRRDACLTNGYRQEAGGLELGSGYTDQSGLSLHGFSQFAASDTSLVGSDQQVQSDSYRMGGAVQYLGSVAYAMAAAGAGRHDHQGRRSLGALIGGDVADSEFDGRDRFGYVEVGTASRGENSLWLTFVSLQGASVELDRIDETGGSVFAADVDAIDADSLRSLTGFSYAQVGGTPLGAATTQLRLGWLHEYADDVQSVSTTIPMTTGGVDLAVRSAELGRDWVSMGLQVDWNLFAGGQITAAYQGNVNGDSAIQSGFGGARWVW